MFVLAINGVCAMISGYSGYRKDRMKEDDLLVRKRLEAEILKSKEHARNILESLHEKQNKDGIKGYRKVNDELDVFSGEVNLSIVGHNYPIFSIQHIRSPSEADLQQLVQFDADMLDSLVNVTTAMSQIESHLIDDSDIDYAKEFAKMRQYITTSRNRYKDRENFLRGWK
jgi:hypothetical protein